ncbi:MAG: hypothetical protein WA918_09045 [Erythrobacter sp.]
MLKLHGVLQEAHQSEYVTFHREPFLNKLSAKATAEMYIENASKPTLYYGLAFSPKGSSLVQIDAAKLGVTGQLVADEDLSVKMTLERFKESIQERYKGGNTQD